VTPQGQDKAQLKGDRPMKHYEITLFNGSFPMVFKCTTATEAFGCMEQLAHGYLNAHQFDLDAIMSQLIEMKNGGLIGTECAAYSIRYIDGEV
jgi:hypothetical protein